MNKVYVFIPVAALSILIAYDAIAGAATSMSSDAMIAVDSKVSDIIDKLTVELIDIEQIESNVSSIGGSELNPGEIASLPNLSKVNTILQKSNFQYVTKITESEPNALKTGTYRVELFEDGKSKGALYIKQPIDKLEIIEGFTAAWDLGIDLPANAVYAVKVTKCPCDYN